MRAYRIASVRREREEGRQHIILADLLTEDGAIAMSGTLGHIIAICEERQYNTMNLEQAKAALKKMTE